MRRNHQHKHQTANCAAAWRTVRLFRQRLRLFPGERHVSRDAEFLTCFRVPTAVRCANLLSYVQQSHWAFGMQSDERSSALFTAASTHESSTTSRRSVGADCIPLNERTQLSDWCPSSRRRACVSNALIAASTQPPRPPETPSYRHGYMAKSGCESCLKQLC